MALVAGHPLKLRGSDLVGWLEDLIFLVGEFHSLDFHVSIVLTIRFGDISGICLLASITTTNHHEPSLSQHQPL